MKKIKFFFSILVISLFFLASSVSAGFFKSSTEKAQEKIDQALELIEIGLNQKSKALMQEAKASMIETLLGDAHNNRALFVLAQSNFYLGDTPKASQQFRKAFQRDVSIGNDIYDFYQRLALMQSKMGKFDAMIKYQIIACDFKPGSRRALAEKFFRDGSKNLFAGNYHASASFYLVASRLNPGFNPTIAIAIRDSAKKLSDPCAQMVLYRYALDYSSDSMNQEIFQLAAYVLKNCKDQMVKKEFDRIKKKAYRNAIYNLAYPPDYINCSRDSKPSFQLEPGEYSPYLRGEYGTSARFQDKYGTYKICFRGGKCYDLQDAPNSSLTDFRFFAITKSDVRVIFE